MKRSIPFLLIAIIACSPAIAQEDWVIKKDEKGIKVYSKKTDSFRVNELKVETIMTGRISQLAAAITDVEGHEKWVYKAASTKLLKQNSQSDLYYYTEIDAPWPFDNRDVVMQMTLQQNPQNKVLTIFTNSIDKVFPLQKDIVRIAFSRGKWTIVPIGSGRLKIDYTIQVDPGMGIPAWLLNLFAVNGPYETFLHLRDAITQSKYAQARSAFLMD